MEKLWVSGKSTTPLYSGDIPAQIYEAAYHYSSTYIEV